MFNESTQFMELLKMRRLELLRQAAQIRLTSPTPNRKWLRWGLHIVLELGRQRIELGRKIENSYALTPSMTKAQ